MKKAYTKPEINEVKVAANQAIAACGVKISGYDNSWARGNNGQFGWKTPEEAWVAYNQHASFEYSETKNTQSPFVFPVYYGEGVDGQGQKIYGTFHDENRNGVMDNGEYIAWQKGDYEATASMLASGTAVVQS